MVSQVLEALQENNYFRIGLIFDPVLAFIQNFRAILEKIQI